METYGQRLRAALDHARKTKNKNQTQVAREVGMAPSGLSELIRSGQGSSFTPKIAEITGVSALWLGNGDGPMLQNDLQGIALGRVPLVSKVAAGMFTEVADLLPAGFADEWVVCTVPVKEHTFALRVEGDSMEPKFPEGMILIVEPELDPRPGDYVIAKNGDNEATFKQLVRDGGDFFLKPLNSRYPMKPLGNARVIGVVRQVLENFR